MFSNKSQRSGPESGHGSCIRESGRSRWIITLVIACAAAAGCEGGRDAASGGNLAGTRWKLAAWPAGQPVQPQITITADFSESQISGTSAVNSYGGTYTATANGRFSVGQLQSTLMGGPEEAMRAEARYLELLQQARKYAVTGATLRLRDGSDQDILVFSAR